jgi:hypothetical protein
MIPGTGPQFHPNLMLSHLEFAGASSMALSRETEFAVWNFKLPGFQRPCASRSPDRAIQGASSGAVS